MKNNIIHNKEKVGINLVTLNKAVAISESGKKF